MPDFSKKLKARATAAKPDVGKKKPVSKNPVDSDQDDPVIKHRSDVEAAPKPKVSAPPVCVAAPFSDGLVNKAFAQSVPVVLRHVAEEGLFDSGLTACVRSGELFVGDISVRPSFIAQKKGGLMF